VLCDVGPAGAAASSDAPQHPLLETRSIVEASDRSCLAEFVDVRDRGGLESLVSAAVDRFGRLDIACVNAGIAVFKPLLEQTQQEWIDQVDVNLTGAWNTLQAVAPVMVRQLSGTILFTASVNGRVPERELTPYVATKHGVLGLMKNVALELGQYNIRSNAVLPGPIHTPMTDNPKIREWIVGRPNATTEEYLEASRHWYVLRGRTALPASSIANAMTWLACDEAEHVTGIELVVDGGATLLPGANSNPVVD
jgi:NAD(P)-dependent dehydrogenase (short-subunit alcohol dehydrogenase family)